MPDPEKSREDGQRPACAAQPVVDARKHQWAAQAHAQRGKLTSGEPQGTLDIAVELSCRVVPQGTCRKTKAQHAVAVLAAAPLIHTYQVLEFHCPAGFFQSFAHAGLGEGFIILKVSCRLVVDGFAVDFFFHDQVALRIGDDAGDGDIRTPALAG